MSICSIYYVLKCVFNVAQFSLILPVEEMEASSESPSLPVGEEKVPSEWERKMESVSSQLSSLEGFTTLFYYYRVGLCELLVLIAHTSESIEAVRRASKQREGSLVSKYESSSVPEFKSSKDHNLL